MRRDFDRKLTALLREGIEAGEFHIGDAHMAALAIGGMVSWAYVSGTGPRAGCRSTRWPTRWRC